jgi:hypothetical protein
MGRRRSPDGGWPQVIHHRSSTPGRAGLLLQAGTRNVGRNVGGAFEPQNARGDGTKR